MRLPSRRSLALAFALAATLGATGCGGGGSSSSSFAVEAVSMPDGAVWQINRPIEVRFTSPVDFSSVGLNTINVRQIGGANTVGEFFLKDPQTVVFQPRCPTETDFSDAALLPGGVDYELTIVGTDTNQNFTVKSASGSKLQVSERRTFSTPTSLSPPVLFFDPVVGPPRPLVRGRDGVSTTELNATYVEVAGSAAVDDRLYFEDTGAGVVLKDSTGQVVDLPLNLFSSAETQIAIVLFVNQPVSPATADGDAVTFEYEITPGTWEEIPTESELVANCTLTGAVFRIEPQGVLPPSTTVRVVLTTSFADLVDEKNQAPLVDFAIADSLPAPVMGALRDEVFESFDISFEQDPQESLEDATAALVDPPADWGNGLLAPGFDFNGTGGTAGTFDVEVPAGQLVIWNTSSQILTGGPNFAPTGTLTAFNGVFDVRSLRVGLGATLRFEGPNPVQVLATGTVDIQGTIIVNGVSHPGVVTINTPATPEPGANGQCGGGRGGQGSPLTNANSPRGGTGAGAFNMPELGGKGGEAGWSTNQQMLGINRRGAGGGGGVFGHDQFVGALVDESFIGLNAEPGFDGPMNLDAMGQIIGAFGAENPQNLESPPNAGGVGTSPFRDGDPTNDFFGRKVDQLSGAVVIGELTTVWAGAGGGGGGDASAVTNPSGIYPDTPFKAFGAGTDEKGAGGGGGGGAITILSVGPIQFGASGQIQCRGGAGGGGESTNFLNRIGGGGGGGSGGHVILQSATAIDFSAKSAGVSGPPAILATGGQGGAGADDDGGASIAVPGETAPAADACHKTTPPANSNCPLGEIESTGGDGGPGLVQLHTPLGDVSTTGDITLPPTGVLLADICFPTPVDPLVPQFGRKSRARSVWVRLGEGGFDINNPGVPTPPTFDFGGTDVLTGSILLAGQQVQPLAPIVPAAPLQAPGAGLPFIAADGFTLVVDASGIAPELTSNPALLRQYWIDFDLISNGTNVARFAIVSASYDASLDQLSLTVSMAGQPLTAAGSPGTVDVLLRPTFFRVIGDGTLDFMPPNVDIEIMFEAAPEDALTGGPDLPNASGMQTDVSMLNMLSTAGTPYEFVRFEVLFDVDKNNTGIGPNQPQAALQFLRLPFQY